MRGHDDCWAFRAIFESVVVMTLSGHMKCCLSLDTISPNEGSAAAMRSGAGYRLTRHSPALLFKPNAALAGGSVGWSVVCALKGGGFDSQSGSVPGFRVQSPVGVCAGHTDG